jgi:hypothetical protein
MCGAAVVLWWMSVLVFLRRGWGWIRKELPRRQEALLAAPKDNETGQVWSLKLIQLKVEESEVVGKASVSQSKVRRLFALMLVVLRTLHAASELGPVPLAFELLFSAFHDSIDDISAIRRRLGYISSRAPTKLHCQSNTQHDRRPIEGKPLKASLHPHPPTGVGGSGQC